MQIGKPVSRRAAAVLAALAVCGLALDAQLTPHRTWNCPPNYIVDDRGINNIADGDKGVARTVNAITSADAWNGAGSGTILKAVKGSVAGFTLGDGVPMINFQDPLSVCTGSCIAASFSGYYTQREPGSGSYRITDADIVFNSSGYAWTSEGEDPGGAGCSSELYVESLAVFQTGRALGLASSAVPGATMYPSVAFCNNTKATTEADDETRIRTLYGTSPCGTCEVYTEYLAVGGSDVQPCASSFSALAGTHGGWITGPAGTNFNLYLDRWNGASWTPVASSAGAGSTESLSYTGTVGTYRYRVVSASGAGTYHFWISRP
jgi:hypothetical protein